MAPFEAQGEPPQGVGGQDPKMILRSAPEGLSYGWSPTRE
jgi:hypothetical protein